MPQTPLCEASVYQTHLQVVKKSLADVRHQKPLNQLAQDMFKYFFERHPEAREIFAPFDMAKIESYKFCKIADALVDVLEYPDYSETSLSEEVFRHQIYDIKDKEYYFALAESLVQAIKNTSGESWNEELEECWADAIAGLKHNIVSGICEHVSSPATAGEG
jgi:hemoglobin-like flavoprotein